MKIRFQDDLKQLKKVLNVNISMEGTNSNNYVQLGSSHVFTLAPAESKIHDAILIFSIELSELKAFQQNQRVVRL
jgi:hypothetical protein